MFFPKEEDEDYEEQVQAAKDFCEDCPVKDLCLEYSFKHPATKKAGIYGGKTVEERQAIDNQRRKK
jgi:hypothetical protein